MEPADDAELEAIVERLAGTRRAELAGLLEAGDVHALVRPLYDSGLVTNRFDWVEWNAASGDWDVDRVATASVADAVRVITTIVRGERFNEGLLEQMWADGTFPAAITRVLAD